VKENEIQDELSTIRNLMERSSKFISLSGLSGILAGIYALIGAAIAYLLIYNGTSRVYITANIHTASLALFELIATAIMVLLLSIITGLILTVNKAKRKGQPVWGNTSRALLFNMALPLITGGLLILILLVRGYYGIVSPASLIFYGIDLVGASNFTFKDVRYLGISEIILGLLAACLPGYGLLFWAIGFGVLHIVYGTIMHFKYDR
jgi:hypothetical protein